MNETAESTKKQRNLVIILSIFWLVAIVVIFYLTTYWPDAYEKVWSRGSTFATICYGFFYYLYSLYEKKKESATEKVITFVALVVFSMMALSLVLAVFKVLDQTKGWWAYVMLDDFSFLILAGFFLSVDGLLYFSDRVKYEDEGWFARLVDIPTFVAFIVIFIFGNRGTLKSLAHFLAGANAFQLVAFNTAFTILLLYLKVFKKRLQPE